jgi:hypothetical protein
MSKQEQAPVVELDKEVHGNDHEISEFFEQQKAAKKLELELQLF